MTFNELCQRRGKFLVKFHKVLSFIVSDFLFSVATWIKTDEKYLSNFQVMKTREREYNMAESRSKMID